MIDTTELLKRLDAAHFPQVPLCYEAAATIRDLQAKLAADVKAHEKETVVWSENYAALERKLAEAWNAALEKAAIALTDRYKTLTEADIASGTTWRADLPELAAQLIRNLKEPT